MSKAKAPRVARTLGLTRECGHQHLSRQGKRNFSIGKAEGRTEIIKRETIALALKLLQNCAEIAHAGIVLLSKKMKFSSLKLW